MKKCVTMAGAAMLMADALAEEAAPQTLPVVEKFVGLPRYVYLILVALIAAGVILSVGSKKNRWNSRRIAMGAMCIAIAFILYNMRLFRMPQGGTITPASMLPIVMFMMACGPLQGFVVGCAFGLLNLIADPYVIHPVQLLLDYPLAFGAMILCCFANNIPVPQRWKLPIGVLLAGVGRYVMAVLSGAIFFAEYAGEQNAWVYSIVYNISYLGPDTLVCALVACVSGMNRIVEMIRKK